MKQKKIIGVLALTSFLIFGLLLSKESSILPIGLIKSQQALIINPSKEVEALITKQSYLSSKDQKTTVLAAFFNLKLDSLSDENKEGLNVLEAAMRSGQKDAAPLIRDLLVDVAHNKIEFDEEYRNQINRLILLMAKEAPYEIEAMKSANPDSIALKYLEKLKG